MPQPEVGIAPVDEMYGSTPPASVRIGMRLPDVSGTLANHFDDNDRPVVLKRAVASAWHGPPDGPSRRPKEHPA